METIISSSNEMKKYDKATSEVFGLPESVLIERAALSVYKGLVDLLEAKYDTEYDADPVLIVCGTGNNGADGLALARLLFLKGYDAHVVLIGNTEKSSPSNVLQKNIFVKYLEYNGIIIKDKLIVAKTEDAPVCVSKLLGANNYFAIIDAIFGIGLSRKIDEFTDNVLEILNSENALRIAIDIPSGIPVKTCLGLYSQNPFRADITYTFGFKKESQMFYPTKEYCGDVKLSDVGIYKYHGGKPYEVNEGKPGLIEHPTALSDFAWPRRKENSHKGTYKKLLIIAGSRDVFGAALLSTMAAFATGVGMVMVITHENNRQYFADKCPESMLKTYNDDTSETECEKMFEEAISWADGMLIGPGIGTERIAKKFLSLSLYSTDKPIVIDADGLNILASHINCHYADGNEDGESTIDLLEDTEKTCDCDRLGIDGEREYCFGKNRQVILTPHIKEYARIGNIDFSKNNCDRFSALYSFCAQHNCTVLLKDTVSIAMTAKNNLPAYFYTAEIIDTGNSGMATAGSGDVLAGITAVLLLQMGILLNPAAAAAYIHGIAGGLAMKEKGPRGMMPSDIIDKLKDVWDEIDKLKNPWEYIDNNR